MMKRGEALELSVQVNYPAIDNKCTMHANNLLFPLMLEELIRFLISSNNAKRICYHTVAGLLGV